MTDPDHDIEQALASLRQLKVIAIRV